MAYDVEIADIASLELAEAYDWYEERSPGLGGRLLSELQDVLVRLRKTPLMYQVVESDTRRAQLRRFPHGVFFVVRGDRVVITAFFHAKRNPIHSLGRESSD